MDRQDWVEKEVWMGKNMKESTSSNLFLQKQAK